MKKYDIVGDIHGHADTLRALLKKLGYEEHDGAYRHPERSVIFVGDFIDRGPKIRETLQIVRAMMESGSALAVMGNHEYNALCFHTPDGRGGHLRPHTTEKVTQHQATLEQIAVPFPDEWRDWVAWFKTLPLFLDLGALRVVHACWDDDQVACLNGSNRLTDALLHASAAKGTPEYRAIEVLLKGKEIELPDGHTFVTKDGVERHEIRVKWWIPGAGKTYYDLSLPTCETAPRLLAPANRSLERGYAETEPPVIVGHYWLAPAKPELLAPNVACVDYSVAKDGPLVVYRWDGEAVLDDGKFVCCFGEHAATESERVADNGQEPPSQDALNRAMGSIMERYSWGAFQVILTDPERLRAWLVENVPQEQAEPWADPEDPAVGEQGVVNADTEQKALELWGELNKEEREKIMAAVRELWGKGGVALLPINLR
ncbi:MAG TPA: metallophosphoesterase [Chthoniobacter sp.]|jgi:hypothetical protein